MAEEFTAEEATQGAEIIDQYARHFEHFVEVSTTLRKIGSVKNHLRELEEARDKKLAEQDLSSAEVTAVHGAIERARAQHDEALAQFAEESEARRLELNEAGQKILDDATAKANAQLEEALETVNQLKADSEEAQEQAAKDLAAALEERANVQEEIAKLKLEQAEESAKLTQIREAIRAITEK